MLSFTKHPNADASVGKLLRQLKINVDQETVSSELNKHPDYPSLLAVSDVLNALNIENSAFRLSFNELADVPCPFIAHLYSNGGELIVVNRMDPDNFHISGDKWNNHTLSAEAFEKVFAGVILVAEPSETFSNRPTTFSDILTRVKTPLIAAGLLLLFASALIFQTGYIANLTWPTLLLTVFKSAGLVTSILLLVQSIDTNNPLVQVLCQNKGKKNCNVILSSKAAKLFDWLSWSEVGFFYFAGTWLLLLFGGNSPFIVSSVLLLNVVSLPYTLYSIYYQARVANQWCVLCCMVQALLWLEFVSLTANFTVSFAGGAAVWPVLFICLAAPVILWSMLKPLFLKAQQLQPLKQQLRTFKYNAELFNAVLNEQPKYTLPDEEWSIVLGNAEANNSITMVTNPYCPPCAKTHQLLDELLRQNDNVQARIVFTANNSEDDIKTPVSRHLMALNDLNDKTIVRRALHDWYEQKQKNYETWAKVYPVELKDSEYYKIDKQHAWCEMAEVTATPTMLVNGYRLPDLYQLPDLKYMLQ
jgi:uncharacterized membrane protein